MGPAEAKKPVYTWMAVGTALTTLNKLRVWEWDIAWCLNKCVQNQNSTIGDNRSMLSRVVMVQSVHVGEKSLR
jgi:hypothetical protein